MTISENKKLILLDLIKQLGIEINTLYHAIEEDDLIPDDRFNEYDKQMECLYHIHSLLEDEILFS
jgi:hypothetical protein